MPGWKVQHTTPPFFLILFINKVTTFHTHHQVCGMVNQLFIIMTYCVCVLIQLNFFFLGKYYVVDSGYPIIKGYLTPYKGISYHLQEFRRRGGSPRTRHEKFNHAHSSLQCTIEHTFGVWKNKWRIIINMPSFPFHIQILIVSATMALHNFVRLNDRDDRGFINTNLDSISRREHNSEAGSSYEQNSGSLTDPAMVVLRDSIANSIWGIIISSCLFFIL